MAIKRKNLSYQFDDEDPSYEPRVMGLSGGGDLDLGNAHAVFNDPDQPTPSRAPLPSDNDFPVGYRWIWGHRIYTHLGGGSWQGPGGFILNTLGVEQCRFGGTMAAPSSTASASAVKIGDTHNWANLPDGDYLVEFDSMWNNNANNNGHILLRRDGVDPPFIQSCMDTVQSGDRGINQAASPVNESAGNEITGTGSGQQLHFHVSKIITVTGGTLSLELMIFGQGNTTTISTWDERLTLKVST